RFEIPPDFNFEKFTESAFNMIWGEAQEVRINFSSWQATYIQERTWHPSQKIEAQPDGSIILTLKVADLGEVKRWLIGFGAEAKRLEPRKRKRNPRSLLWAVTSIALGRPTCASPQPASGISMTIGPPRNPA